MMKVIHCRSGKCFDRTISFKKNIAILPVVIKTNVPFSRTQASGTDIPPVCLSRQMPLRRTCIAMIWVFVVVGFFFGFFFFCLPAVLLNVGLQQ